MVKVTMSDNKAGDGRMYISRQEVESAIVMGEFDAAVLSRLVELLPIMENLGRLMGKNDEDK